MESLLYLGCNMIELLRLKEEICNAFYETKVLGEIYQHQLKHTNKESFKLMFSDALNFDVT